MRKIYLLLAFLFILSANAVCQETINHYHCSYFDKDLMISASEKDGVLDLWIQICGNENNDIVVINLMGEDEINSFIGSMSKLRDKYAEWRQTAIDNNVGDYIKPFDIYFSNVTIGWKFEFGEDWYFDFEECFEPTFLITDAGKIIMAVHSEAQSTSKEYITEKYYFILSSVYEFDDLISKITPDAVRKKLKAKSSLDELFK